MNVFELKDVSKVFPDGTQALRGVSFNIRAGEFVAVMGPSGSGKSTLLHIMGFLDKPTGGTFKFEEKFASDYTNEEAAYIRNKKLGFIFQQFNLLPRMTVKENVKLPLFYSGMKETEWDKRVEEKVSAVGLDYRANQQAFRLSGGEKQRVAIARALVNNPPVIFADEPTGNLDSKSGAMVMEEIQKLHDQGHTVILITHETYTAEHAERIIRLKDGLIESDGRVEHQHRIVNGNFAK